MTETTIEYVRCEHDTLTPVKVTELIPARQQARREATNHPRLVAHVCHRRECITDAMAWIKRSTGNKAAWLNAAGALEARKPSRDLELIH